MNLSAFDMNLLPVLEALLEEASVSGAARRVGLSQPAVSNALARLRSALDDPLLVRDGRRMRATPRAQELGAALRAGLGQIRNALSGDSAFEPARSTRLFRAGMSDGMEWFLAAPLMRRLIDASPEVRLQIRRLEALFLAPEADLNTGALDLAIGYFPDARALQVGTASETLGDDEHVVVLRRHHPALRGPWNIERFASLDHAAIIYRSELWGLVDSQMATLGLRRRLRLASPNFLTVLKAVSDSNLIAYVPARLARNLATSLGLATRPVPFTLPPFFIRMVWRQSATEDPALRWLRSLIRETLASL